MWLLHDFHGVWLLFMHRCVSFVHWSWTWYDFYVTNKIDWHQEYIRPDKKHTQKLQLTCLYTHKHDKTYNMCIAILMMKLYTVYGWITYRWQTVFKIKNTFLLGELQSKNSIDRLAPGIIKKYI